MKKIDISIQKIIIRVIIATLVCVLLIAGLYSYSVYLSKQNKEIQLGTDNEEYSFVSDVSKSWSEQSHGFKYGTQVDLAVENKTKDTMLNWDIVLDVVPGCRIDSNWNGEFVLDEEANTITITCLDYNDTVDPGEMQSFGMILYGPEKFNVTDGRIIYHINKSLIDMPVFWAIIILFCVFLISEINEIFYTRQNMNLVKKNKTSMRIINQSFVTFANTIDAKDTYTKGHSQRVAYYSRELAKRLNCDSEFQQNIFYVALLHDIGKIGVQDAILKKSAKLTYDEFNVIKEHVSMGGDILKRFNAIPGIEEGARYHHEKYDGSGYMEGLKGEEIPYLARIIAVADAFDAMSSTRCYRSPMSNEAIIRELNEYSGKQFDPLIVPHMINMIDEGAAPIVLTEDQLEAELDLL